jgi:nucleotide-binding universal stress UspA family protein
VSGTESHGPVVVGVSGSLESDAAVDWAADFAAASHRELVVVHTVAYVEARPTAEGVVEDEGAATEAGWPLAAAATQRAVSHQPGVSATGVVEVGDPASVLLTHGPLASALVVGARHGDGSRLPHRSTSQTVARHAPCPVIVVPVAPDGPGALGHRVVVGIDGSPASRGAAEFAFEYASLTHLPLAILHGSWERFARGSAVLRLLSRDEEHDNTEEERLTIAETIGGLPETYPDVEFHDVHRSTDPAAALIEASEAARLVVVGARHRSDALSLVLRSVSTSLVAHAHCPVAVVHSL